MAYTTHCLPAAEKVIAGALVFEAVLPHRTQHRRTRSVPEWRYEICHREATGLVELILGSRFACTGPDG